MGNLDLYNFILWGKNRSAKQYVVRTFDFSDSFAIYIAKDILSHNNVSYDSNSFFVVFRDIKEYRCNIILNDTITYIEKVRDHISLIPGEMGQKKNKKTQQNIYYQFSIFKIKVIYSSFNKLRSELFQPPLD